MRHKVVNSIFVLPRDHTEFKWHFALKVSSRNWLSHRQCKRRIYLDGVLEAHTSKLLCFCPAVERPRNPSVVSTQEHGKQIKQANTNEYLCIMFVKTNQLSNR